MGKNRCESTNGKQQTITHENYIGEGTNERKRLWKDKLENTKDKEQMRKNKYTEKDHKEVTKRNKQKKEDK